MRCRACCRTPVELGDPGGERRRALAQPVGGRGVGAAALGRPRGIRVPQGQRVRVAWRRAAPGQVGGDRAELRLGVRAEAGGERGAAGEVSRRRVERRPEGGPDRLDGRGHLGYLGKQPAHGADGGSQGDRRAGDGRQVPAGERHRGAWQLDAAAGEQVAELGQVLARGAFAARCRARRPGRRRPSRPGRSPTGWRAPRTRSPSGPASCRTAPRPRAPAWRSCRQARGGSPGWRPAPRAPRPPARRPPAR